MNTTTTIIIITAQVLGVVGFILGVISLSRGGPAVERERRLWFIEIWFENREAFKELMKGVLGFGTFVVVLTVLHELLKLSSLPENYKVVIDKVHFYPSVVALVILSVSFIIKIAIFEVRGEDTK